MLLGCPNCRFLQKLKGTCWPCSTQLKLMHGSAFFQKHSQPAHILVELDHHDSHEYQQPPWVRSWAMAMNTICLIPDSLYIWYINIVIMIPTILPSWSSYKRFCFCVLKTLYNPRLQGKAHIYKSSTRVGSEIQIALYGW